MTCKAIWQLLYTSILCIWYSPFCHFSTKLFMCSPKTELLLSSSTLYVSKTCIDLLTTINAQDGWFYSKTFAWSYRKLIRLGANVRKRIMWIDRLMFSVKLWCHWIWSKIHISFMATWMQICFFIEVIDHTNSSIDLPKLDQIQEGKWLIHDTKSNQDY